MASQRRRSSERGSEEEMYDGRVMTEDQIEVLRHQISCYADICERLVLMHRSITTAQQDSLAIAPPGMRLGGLYFDPFTVPKITARQRWTPTPAQLHILESLFDQGIGTPSKAKIKEVTLELSQHGQISEANVYNWFQNRRARSKRKQTAALPNNSESEVETDVESSNEMKAKLKKVHPHDELPLGAGHLSFHGTETSSEVHYFDQEIKQTQGIYVSENSAKSSGNLNQISYENILSNLRTEQLMGKMEIPESYGTFRLGESYNLEG